MAAGPRQLESGKRVRKKRASSATAPMVSSVAATCVARQLSWKIRSHNAFQ